MKRTVLMIWVAALGAAVAAGQSKTLSGELTCFDCDATATFTQGQTKDFASSNSKLTIKKQFTWSDATSYSDFNFKLKLSGGNDSDTVSIGDSNGNSNTDYLEIELDNGNYYKGSYWIDISAETKDITYGGNYCKDTDSDTISISFVNESFTFDTATDITSPYSWVGKFEDVTVKGTAKAEPPYSGASWESVKDSTPITLSASNGSWSASPTVYTSNGQWSKTFNAPTLGWDTNYKWNCTATLPVSDFTNYGANTSYATSSDSVSVDVGGTTLVFNTDFNAGIIYPWENIDNTGNGGWATNVDFGIDNYTGGDGFCATIDSDWYGGVDIDAELASTVFTVCPESTMEFDTDFRWYAGGGDEQGDVDIEPLRGSWQNLISFHGEDYNGHVVINLGDYAGEEARLRFHYYDAFGDWWWQVDNVQVTGIVMPTAACCFPDGSCEELTQEECASAGGEWHEGEDCGSYDCPQPTGACCLPGGWCENLTEDECLTLGGDWYYGENCGDFVCPGDPPANDDCGSATPIGDIADLSFCTTHATHDGGGTCITSPNVWFCYAASCDGLATISLCGSGYDTMLAVYDGCICDPLGSELACNGDSFGCGAQSEWQGEVVAGQTYLIEVGGHGDAAGPGLLTVICEPVGACCLPDGSCAELTESACVEAGGEHQGDDVVCWDAGCPGCEAPQITVQPDDPMVCVEGLAFFLINVDGTPPFFWQWRKYDPDGGQWVEIPGATEPFCVIEAVTEDDAGEYDVVVENYCGQAVSEPALLTVGLPGPLDNGTIRAHFTDYGTSGARFADPPIVADIAWLEASQSSQLWSWEGNLHYDDGGGPANHLLNDANEFTVDSPACRFDDVVESESHSDEFAVQATHWLDGALLTTQLEITNISGGDLSNVNFAWMLDADLIPPDDDPHEPCCPNLPWLGFGTGQWDGAQGQGTQDNLNTCAGIDPANVVAKHSAHVDDTQVPDEWTVSNPVGYQGATCAFDGPVEAEPRYLFQLPFDNTAGQVGNDQDLAIVTNFQIDLWADGVTHTFVYTLKFESGVLLGDLNCDGDVNFDDINPFVLALTDPATWQATYPGCPIENADINGDGEVDFNDINPFVALLTGG